MNIFHRPIVAVVLVFTLFTSPVLWADGNSIDKVEHPYVNANEKEIALASFYQNDHDNNSNTPQDNVLKHKLSFGWALTDNWFAEIAFSGKKVPDQRFKESSVELEAKWQITEQGEYSADYGLLFEYENEDDINVEEVSMNLLVERQWNKWVGTANVKGIYEWGDAIKDEFETALALQTKYRYQATLEPAIEGYLSQKNKGIGPVLLGQKRLASGKKLKWEVGVIFALDKESPDQTYRALLEYEFQ